MSDNWGIVGHRRVRQALRYAIERETPSHAYLLTGPEGIGKTTLALKLAQALLCREESPPCGTCRACRLVAAGHHPDLHLVEAAQAGGRLKIEQMRDLRRTLSLTPVEGRHRVAILQHFEKATEAAANALLKTLEEPPPYAVLLLLADDADHLLPTIVSRCRHLLLRPLPVETVRQALIERWQADEEQATLLAHLSGGRIGWAVRVLQDETVLQTRKKRLDDLVHLLHAPTVERFRYAENLARDPVALRETLTTWQGWWRDMLLIAARADVTPTNVDRLTELRQYAARLGVPQSAAVVQAIAETNRRLEANVNPRLAVENLMLDLPTG